MREFVGRAAGQGVEVILLAAFEDGGIPSADQARGLGAWAREFGPGGTFWQGRSDGAYASRYIEFGNETSYSYQGTQNEGGQYALRARDAIEAIKAANPRVGLLVQADDANINPSPWVRDMFNAVPNLGNLAAGWTVHPYGPRSRWEPKISNLINQTAAAGSPPLPIFATEYGISTDDGRTLSDNYEWPTNMTYQQAADAILRDVPAMNARFPGRMAVLLWYFIRDHAAPGASSDREDYFGAIKEDRSDKGAADRGHAPAAGALPRPLIPQRPRGRRRDAGGPSGRCLCPAGRCPARGSGSLDRERLRREDVGLARVREGHAEDVLARLADLDRQAGLRPVTTLLPRVLYFLIGPFFALLLYWTWTLLLESGLVELHRDGELLAGEDRPLQGEGAVDLGDRRLGRREDAPAAAAAAAGGVRDDPGDRVAGRVPAGGDLGAEAGRVDRAVGAGGDAARVVAARHRDLAVVAARGEAADRVPARLGEPEGAVGADRDRAHVAAGDADAAAEVAAAPGDVLDAAGGADPQLAVGAGDDARAWLTMAIWLGAGVPDVLAALTPVSVAM